ncbi:hypothetical protein BDV98DRAFT_557498 [Pterulicium gracile]|uniref:Uncharacterized protein n=1 Tax=Pterulicium gracile TaxID=1884261 RepID=A0A5C3R3C3_9AGAR|nr:hypothetical protein BDV98DRAFT_557498 [Pterula gracilis]
MHTAHILSAHATLDQKSKVIQDVKEQQNKLESERQRLLQCLREINEDRGKMDIAVVDIEREVSELRHKITETTEGDYATAKREVDRLRHELGQPALPSLQSTIEEKRFAYLNERRLNGSEKRPSEGISFAADGQQPPTKKARGRPKGSKNSTKKASSGG